MIKKINKSWATLLTFEMANDFVITTLVLNLVIDFGNWMLMLRDILSAVIKIHGYIIPK